MCRIVSSFESFEKYPELLIHMNDLINLKLDDEILICANKNTKHHQF